MRKRVLFCAALFAVTSVANEGNYTVIEEDNLWNLSGEFLGDPTEWQTIWSQNQQINNPDLIYPGDSIYIPGVKSNSSVESTTDLQQNGAQTFAQSVASLGEVNTEASDSLDQENTTPATDTNPLQTYFNNQSDLYSVATLRSAPYIISSTDEDVDPIIPGVGNINDESHPLFGLNSIVTVIADEGHLYQEGEIYELSSSIKYMRHEGAVVNVVLPTGAGIITSVWGDSARLRITDIWSNIISGARVSHYRDIKPLNQPRVDRNVLPIEINSLTRIKEDVAVKPYDNILLDAGSDSDIRIGDLFVAVAVNENNEMEHDACFQGIVVNVDETSSALKIHGVYKLASGNTFRLKRFGRLIFE